MLTENDFLSLMYYTKSLPECQPKQQDLFNLCRAIQASVIAVQEKQSIATQAQPEQPAGAQELRYTADGALAECPCCGSLDVGGVHDTVNCYGCGLTVTAPRPLQNAINKWNQRTNKAPAPATAINEQLLEALKELMYARTDKAEGMAEAAIAAAEAAKGGV